MIYHTMPQHIELGGNIVANPEWLAVRQGKLTASGLGDWILDPCAIRMTKDEICSELLLHGISHKPTWKRDELLDLLPDKDSYRKLCQSAQLMIDSILGEQADEERPVDNGNFWTRRGLRLEPEARREFEKLQGIEVQQFGFIEREDLPIGFSPDGMTTIGDCVALLEIKCHEGKTHLAHLRAGGVPEEHQMQMHAQMAISGISRAEYFGYHPNLPPVVATLRADETTEMVREGLETVARHLVEQRTKLTEQWIKWDKERKI